jgi:hypothetical protein
MLVTDCRFDNSRSGCHYFALSALTMMIALILLFDGAFAHAIYATAISAVYADLGYRPPH